jgi:hypothetical protein
MPKPVLLSTAYFPPIIWFTALLKGAGASIETCETYAKQSFRNRCHILGPNGLQALTVPVTKPFGNKTKTTEIAIANQSNWKRTHWRAIETAYNTSPFFLFYRDRFSETLFRDRTSLFELNLSIINICFEVLGMDTVTGFTKNFIKDPTGFLDLRHEIHPKKPLNLENPLPTYTQVFSPKHGFVPNLSVIDLIFNEGPASPDYLLQLDKLLAH